MYVYIYIIHIHGLLWACYQPAACFERSLTELLNCGPRESKDLFVSMSGGSQSRDKDLYRGFRVYGVRSRV